MHSQRDELRDTLLMGFDLGCGCSMGWKEPVCPQLLALCPGLARPEGLLWPWAFIRVIWFWAS